MTGATSCPKHVMVASSNTTDQRNLNVIALPSKNLRQIALQWLRGLLGLPYCRRLTCRRSRFPERTFRQRELHGRDRLVWSMTDLHNQRQQQDLQRRRLIA